MLTKRGLRSGQHVSPSTLKVLSVEDVCGTAEAGCEQHLSLAGRGASWLSVWHTVVSQSFAIT